LGTESEIFDFTAVSPKEKYITDGFETEPIVSLICKEYTIGIVLVRLGHFTVGVCQGEKLLLHDSGTGLIHGVTVRAAHRRPVFNGRKDQTHHFLERVSEHLQEQLAPYARILDFLVYGGARVTILRLQKQCPFLAQFEDRLLPPLLEVQDPRFSVLEKALRMSGQVKSQSGVKDSLYPYRQSPYLAGSRFASGWVI